MSSLSTSTLNRVAILSALASRLAPYYRSAMLSGEEKLTVFESSIGKERVFCCTCGSPIFSRRMDKPGILRVRAGTLDNPTGAQLGEHAYGDSKADWWPHP